MTFILRDHLPLQQGLSGGRETRDCETARRKASTLSWARSRSPVSRSPASKKNDHLPLQQGLRPKHKGSNQQWIITPRPSSTTTRIFRPWPLTKTMTAFTSVEAVMVLVWVDHEAQAMMSSISLTQGLLWFPRGMEVVIGWQRRRQMAFTVRRL